MKEMELDRGPRRCKVAQAPPHSRPHRRRRDDSGGSSSSPRSRSRPKLVILRRAIPIVPYEGDDLISALPDDLLLQVLGRLGSVPAAAPACRVSRRWRDLWTRLPKVTVAIHDVPFGLLKAALIRVAPPAVCHYYLDIRVPGQDDKVSAASVSSLLAAAAALWPLELRFTLPRDLRVSCMDVVLLPCFSRATSIELHARDLRVSHSWGCYHSLETLSLSGCHVDIVTFTTRCPRLRLLRLSTINMVGMDNITIHSASLEELIVEHRNRWTCLSRISVDAPVLKQLTMSFHAHSDVGVSILAPMMEQVSWRCLYTGFIYGLGLWGISEVGFKTVERHEQTDSQEDGCLQLPSAHVLSLHMCAQDSLSFPNAELSFMAEIDKHIVTNFSSLDLHLRTKGHVFGAIVLHLLGLHRIRTSIRNLKIVLLGSEVKDACSLNCPCEETKDRRTQSIYLANLEKVQIEGVEGEDHEFYFLQEIFKSAPMLRRVALRLSDEATPSDYWCMKINDIPKAYPAVECTVDFAPVSCISCKFLGGQTVIDSNQFEADLVLAGFFPLYLLKKWTAS